MRKKALAAAMALTAAVSAFTPAYAAENAEPESIAQETEAKEIHKEAEGRMPVLKDAGYKAGILSTAGWFSRYLNLQYVPGSEAVRMNEDLNGYLQGYYRRNGEEKMVSSSEFVASMDTENMIQLTTEVNPKNEKAEDILSRFVEIDEMKDAGEADHVQMGDYDFLVVSGVIDGRNSTIGISTSRENIVLELKATYSQEENKEMLLNGFALLDEEQMKKVEDEKNVKAVKPENTQEETVAADNADLPGNPGITV